MRAKPVPAVRVPKALGTMLMLPATISGAEVIRIVSASVLAQTLTLSLVELLCAFVVAPTWVLPIRQWRAVGDAPYGEIRNPGGKWTL